MFAHATWSPATSTLHDCISVCGVESLHVAPAPVPHVGVWQVRVCVPVWLHVFGIVCVHALQGSHVVAPHAPPPVPVTVHARLTGGEETIVVHVSLMHVYVVEVRVCVPVVAHVEPTMQSVQSLVMVVPHDVPSVLARMHACISGMSVV